MAVHLVYSDFLIKFQLFFNLISLFYWDSGKVIRNTFLVAFCLNRTIRRKKSRGVLQKKIATKPYFTDMELRKDANHHLISRDSSAHTL